MSKLED